jgi:hypothetical protein
MDEPRLLYRYSDLCVKDDPVIQLEIYRILKETRRGYVVIANDWFGATEKVINLSKRFIPKKTKRPFAFFNKEDALLDYNYVKQRQIETLKKKLIIAEKLFQKSSEVCSNHNISTAVYFNNNHNSTFM